METAQEKAKLSAASSELSAFPKYKGRGHEAVLSGRLPSAHQRFENLFIRPSYYMLLRALRLVSLAGRILLYGLLEFKVGVITKPFCDFSPTENLKLSFTLNVY